MEYIINLEELGRLLTIAPIETILIKDLGNGLYEIRFQPEPWMAQA